MRRRLGFRRKVAFCMTATRNYFPMAAVLIDSIRATYGRQHDIYLLILSADCIPKYVASRERIGRAVQQCFSEPKFRIEG